MRILEWLHRAKMAVNARRRKTTNMVTVLRILPKGEQKRWQEPEEDVGSSKGR